MDKKNLIELTGDIYRLTLFFPKKEPLRYRMREMAIDILSNPRESNLDTLDSFLDIALSQHWVSPSDILVIKEKYAIIREDLGEKKKDKKELGGTVEPETIDKKELVGNGDSPDRKEIIMAFLKNNDKAQVWQLKEVLPDISKRTLRRDFEKMLEDGLIERIGEKNDTFYKIKSA